jgi:excisionase family DNA binding protein
MLSGMAQKDSLDAIRQQYPPILTTAQVAELLGLNVRTVMVMANDGRLPASRLPGSRKYHFILEDVLATLTQHRLPQPVAGENKPAKEPTTKATPAKRAMATTKAAPPKRARRSPGK